MQPRAFRKPDPVDRHAHAERTGTARTAGFRLALETDADAVRSGWPDADLERAILHDRPRRFRDLPAKAPADVLAAAPPLAHTRWDALIAALTGHVAPLHGHDLPAWIDEPERFLHRTRVLPDIPFMRRNAILYAPAAVIRHGALPDPRDLDARGGERQACFPTSHHFALGSQKDSTESDGVVLAFAPDGDPHPDHTASRAAETCYHPDEDLCDQCGALEEYYRDALKRRCRAELRTPAEVLRRLARDAPSGCCRTACPPGVR